MRMVFLASLIETVTERGRRLMSAGSSPRLACVESLAERAERLLSARGEASGAVLARSVLDDYESLRQAERDQFLRLLTDAFGADELRLARAVAAYQREAGGRAIQDLHAAAEPRRQELIRRLNHAPGGTHDLVRMREDVLDAMRRQVPVEPLDADFRHLFTSWFNRGFLVLHQVDWATPANILEKIIRYEAVHEIQDWADLRRRLEPADRRCFAFFHPRLAGEPLIFVEVALTRDIPSAIAPLLEAERDPIRAEDATTAVFYSISNCQRGLANVSFGNFLIKQVVEELKAALPRLSTFVTLSPVPGFAEWVQRERQTESSCFLREVDKGLLDAVRFPAVQGGVCAEAHQLLLSLAADYLMRAKTPSGRPADPVARFHLGNGARLERINWMGDSSSKGLRQAGGLMVNYLYDLPRIVENHEGYDNHGTVEASSAVKRLLRDDHRTRGLALTQRGA